MHKKEDEIMKIAILGTGAYGLALSSMFYENKCDITLWTAFEEEKNMLEKERKNTIRLPEYTIPDDIKITTSLIDATKNAKLIVITVPAPAVDDISRKLQNIITNNQHVCIASKGIEQDTCLFVCDVLGQYIKTNKLAIISGGSFAIDIIQKVPIGLSLGTKNKETEKIIKNALQNKYLKLRTTDDIIGVEICGSIKNVIAIASGMIDGMNLPESTKAMFITESLHDIKKLINALGGNKKTILSFAGFGDLLLTCTSKKSRNFTLGYLIGNKKSKEEIQNYINNNTIEGLYTLKSIYKLLNNKKVDMPIIDLIYDIIYNNKQPEELITFLVNKE